MPAPESVKKLIETFGNNIDFYKSAQYNEAQLRQEFLDPFFKALGWDMDNEAGLAPQYRDVIHEASIKIGGSTKAPNTGRQIDRLVYDLYELTDDEITLVESKP